MSHSPSTIELTNHAVMGAEGKPLALLGIAFLKHVQLNNPAALVSFGLADIWFARYVAAGMALPHPSGKLKHFDKSQLRLKLTPQSGLTSEQWRRQHEPALIDHLLKHLNLPVADIDQIKIELDETCCYSPCFGCMAITG